MQYYTCEKCGASLDPGERCDCTEFEEKLQENKESEPQDNQTRSTAKVSNFHNPNNCITYSGTSQDVFSENGSVNQDSILPAVIDNEKGGFIKCLNRKD